MDVSALIARSRRLWKVDDYQYTNLQALEDLNIIYHDIENTIVTEVSEDFFWDYFVTDTVIWQEEYRLPKSLSWNYTSLYKSIQISIKYRNDFEEYKKAEKIYPYLLSRDLSDYKEWYSRSSPFYHISDDSFFIYPAPKESVNDWLKIYWIKNLKDLNLNSIEDDLFSWTIPTKFHYIISLWMLEFIYMAQNLTNEAINARARYERERSKLVEYLSDRQEWIIEREDWDLSYYK